VGLKKKALPWAVTRRARAKRAAWRPGRLLERGRHNLRWQVEVVAQVLNAIIGEVPVVVLPGEGLPDVLLGLEALHELDHLQVGHIDLRVLRQVVVLLGVQHALFEEILADLIAVLLGDDHGGQRRTPGAGAPGAREVAAATGFDVRRKPPGGTSSVSLRVTPDPRSQADRGGRLPNYLGSERVVIGACVDSGF
jgi:hypothetical protein